MPGIGHRPAGAAALGAARLRPRVMSFAIMRDIEGSDIAGCFGGEGRIG